MPYCTLKDLIKRFGESEINDLLDRDSDGLHESETLDMTIADADGLIDGFLGVRYKVPIHPVRSPKAFKSVCLISCDISRYLLWDDNTPTGVQERYDRAIKLLEMYRDNEIVLPDAQAAPQNPSGGVDFIANERVFTSDSLKGF